MKSNVLFLAAVAIAAIPGAARAQFADPFNSIDPAWVANRYDPAGFASVIFDGDSRLLLTIDQSGSAADRPAQFSSGFYDTQGRMRPGGITGLWTLSAQVYVSSAFDTTTGTIVGAELWGHSGDTPAGGDYAILGFTNASPTDPFNAAAPDRAFTFDVFDTDTGVWIDLGVPANFAFDAWYTLSETATGSSFEYFIDGSLVFSEPTTEGDDLLSAIIQGENYNQAGSYSVYWDNVTATAIPEPAGMAPVLALAALGAACLLRRPENFGIAVARVPARPGPWVRLPTRILAASPHDGRVRGSTPAG